MMRLYFSGIINRWKKSLYEKIYAKEFNGLEKDCAIHLDGHAPLNGGIAWRLK